MKIVERDPSKLAKEKAEREANVIEDLKRTKYLEALRNNHAFKKYVIEGIIKSNLDHLTDIRNIKTTEFKDMEEVGKLVFQAQAARKILEKILGDILN